MPDKNSIEKMFLFNNFLSNQMVELIQIITKKKILKSRTTFSETIEKNNEESYTTQGKKSQNASIQSKVIEQAINVMGDTIEDMVIEREQEDNKTEFLEIKIGLPDSKVIGEMNGLALNKTSSKRSGEKILDRINEYYNIHKYIQKTD